MHPTSTGRLPWSLRTELSLAERLSLVSHPLLWPHDALTCMTPPHILLTSPLTQVTPLTATVTSRPCAVTPGASVLTPPSALSVRSDGDPSCALTGEEGHDLRLRNGATSSGGQPGSPTADGGRLRGVSHAERTGTLKFGVSAILGTDREHTEGNKRTNYQGE